MIFETLLIIFLAITVPVLALLAIALFIDCVASESIEKFMFGSGLVMGACVLISRGNEALFERYYIISMVIITAIVCACVLIKKIKNAHSRDSISNTTID